MKTLPINNLLKVINRINIPRRFSSNAPILRTCVVGSGPAGFYSSQYLLKHLPNVKVDMIEKLPVPFGLGNE